MSRQYNSQTIAQLLVAAFSHVYSDPSKLKDVETVQFRNTGSFEAVDKVVPGMVAVITEETGMEEKEPHTQHQGNQKDSIARPAHQSIK